MPIRKFNEPIRYAGDPVGPFAGDGRLRVLIDLPSHLRQIEAGPWEGPTAAAPEHILWSICQGSPDIEVHWLAQPDESGPGAIRLKAPDIGNDQWPYTFINVDGAEGMSAISLYRQLKQAADQDPNKSLNTYAKAALSRDRRAHITVTDDPDLLSLTGFYARYINPMNTADALAAVGLCLRHEDPSLAGWAPKIAFRVGTHTLAWSAVRSQLPSGWTWGSALVNHSTATSDDHAMLLFGSFHERLVRTLNQRDNIHRATLQPANNKTGNEATEALDTLMFNVVGAFDAAAIAAHMGAGRPPGDRMKAGWQWKEWRKDLGVAHLYEMFHKKEPADDVLTVCRRLRNTVHGAGLSSMVSSSVTSKDTFVRLPQGEAAEIVERLNRLAPAQTWGTTDGFRDSVYIDPARLVEGLLPHIFATLEEVLANTPLDHFAGTLARTQGPPTDGSFDLNTRARACLLYGLRPPA